MLRHRGGMALALAIVATSCFHMPTLPSGSESPDPDPHVPRHRSKGEKKRNKKFKAR